MLNMTKCKVELISNPDMYIFFEKGMGGEVSFISNRYRSANNKYLKSYYPKQESKHIIHLDTNDLFGYVMSKFLPTSGFKWIHPRKFELINILAIVWKDVFMKLSLSILKSYKNYTMSIH